MTVTQRLPHPRSVLFGLVMTALLSAVGCYGEDYTRVTGHVYLNGDPVTAGTVVFTSMDTQGVNLVYSTTIQPDGTYTLDVLLAGSYQVTLLNPQAPLPGVIPARYASTDTSGLSVSLPASGVFVTYNINLTY